MNPPIKNYKKKYKDFPTIPIWMLTEIISFGQLSHFYKYLKKQDKKEISKNFKLHHKKLEEWLHVLNYVRNICAHHHRLWNNELSIRPKRLKNLKKAHLQYDRVFFVLIILHYLLQKIEKNNNWKDKIVNLIKPIIKKYNWANKSMGIPDKGLEEIEKLSNVFERSFKQNNS